MYLFALVLQKALLGIRISYHTNSYCFPMWQCLCTIFAGSGRTETSFRKWKSIDALGPEYERTKQDIIGNYARYRRYLNCTN